MELPAEEGRGPPGISFVLAHHPLLANRVRAVIVVVVILLLRLGVFRGYGLNTDPWRAGLGLALFSAGLGFAI